MDTTLTTTGFWTATAGRYPFPGTLLLVSTPIFYTGEGGEGSVWNAGYVFRASA